MSGKLYTTYFGNRNNFPESGRIYSIVRKPLSLPNIECFAPSLDLLCSYKSKRIDFRKFADLYLQELINNEDAIKTFDSLLEVLNQGEDIILVCYEKSNEYCHRRLLAEVFMHYGVNYCGEL